MSAIPVTRVPASSRTKARAQSQRRARVRTASWVLSRFALFVVVGASTFLISSISGQVLLENARRDGIASQRRANEAKRAEVSLRARINELTGFSNLESWAVAHGFVAPEQPFTPAGGPTRVAQLDR